MPRKKWEAKTEITDSLLKFREKRKWQINLRRYVIEQSPCPQYAPYFGIDNKNIRKWFECQFTEDLSWENFGKAWQFEHIVPVAYFDHDKDEEIRMCWNFTNLRVESFDPNNRGSRVSILGARAYFSELYEKTGYEMARNLMEKIRNIEQAELTASKAQQAFLIEQQGYLSQIGNYSAFEFELLNGGRSVKDVENEIELLNKISSRLQ